MRLWLLNGSGVTVNSNQHFEWIIVRPDSLPYFKRQTISIMVQAGCSQCEYGSIVRDQGCSSERTRFHFKDESTVSSPSSCRAVPNAVSEQVRFPS